MQSVVTEIVKSSVAWAGWRIPCPAPSGPVILLYHGTPRNTIAGRLDEASFAEQIRFLKRHCEIIAPEELSYGSSGRRPKVLLTFDDGFRNNWDVACPILRAYDAPAVFFISSRHSETGKYLWFAYLRALEDWYPETALTFRGQTFSMRPECRRASLEHLKNILLGLRPHPTAMYEAIEHELPALEEFMPEERISDLCAGMTAEQVCQLAADPLFTIGCHTVDHPFLTRCEPAEMLRQIVENKNWLQQATVHPLTAVAYPSGDYNSEVVAVCESQGFGRGYAVIPANRPAGVFELARIGVYRPSLDVLGFLVRWGNVARAMRVPMG